MTLEPLARMYRIAALASSLVRVGTMPSRGEVGKARRRPGASFFSREAVLGVVLAALIGCTPAAAPRSAEDPLAASMKGYELYVWDNGGEIWFTLLPGTNREKTPDEIFSGVRSRTEPDGQFAITASGLDALDGQLGRIPHGATLIATTLRYPPRAMLEVLATDAPVAQRLTRDAGALGLELTISGGNPTER